MGSNVPVPPLVVHYQPVVELETGRVAGAESLIRFRLEDGTLVSPAQDGLIERIEADSSSLERLMRELLREIAKEIVPLFEQNRWFYVGVNVPPAVIGTGVVRDIFKELLLWPHAHRFMVEVTERQALSPEGRDALAAVRALGARVAIDDFGTGQSGLQQIIGLDFDVLKVDRSQVQALMTSPLADRLLRGVVALAGALRVHVTAEGVETREQALFLRAAGVDCGQGWYWSKALPAAEFADVLTSGFVEKQRW